VKDLRRKFDRFLYNNSDRGIPNLMMYLSIATLVCYIIIMADRSGLFYSFLCFDRRMILRGQIWRLFTYVILPQSDGIWLFLLLIAYYSIGRMVERVWGTLKFNLFYLCGVVIMDIAAMILGTGADTYYLNLSLFLALATLYPENKVLLMYIIPIRMKYLAWVYLFFVVIEVVQLNFFPVFALLNYFLFFGRDFLNVLPENLAQRFRRNDRPNANWASGYQKRPSSAQSSRTAAKKVVDAPTYRHKCAVCGRTDVTNPELEFRYCSKCSGYYCYCEDHINHHAHIQ